MAKYGSKLYFIDLVNNTTRRLYEYDTKNSSVEIYGAINITLNTGATNLITPRFIRIVNVNYTEPVSIEGCPMSISVQINSSSINSTQQVSWTEPTLNAWSNCATLEFLGPGTNGGNFSKGVYNISYEASDLNGNTDTCTFMVTVEEMPNDEPTTETSPSSTPSEPSDASTTDTSPGSTLSASSGVFNPDSSSTSPQSGFSGGGNAPCSNENPPSGGGVKASCTFIHWICSIALLVTVFI
ncbi:uncharacterized protein LOC121420569 [Lytechinus variegatus]|uniref:uncharacterized protein LOC121420569 n=1 Tax=Lytechinus variegatus TaxID=7654 RepID=UPI001BB26D56|nr:uncharacterized protein LOC121420569 [Lytechinus variegatus]